MNVNVSVNVPCPRGRWTTPHTRVSCTLPCLQVDEILHTLSWTKPSRSPRPPPADRRPASLWSHAHRNWSIWTRLLTPNWQIQQKQSGELHNDLKVHVIMKYEILHNQPEIFIMHEICRWPIFFFLNVQYATKHTIWVYPTMQCTQLDLPVPVWLMSQKSRFHIGFLVRLPKNIDHNCMLFTE